MDMRRLRFLRVRARSNFRIIFDIEGHEGLGAACSPNGAGIPERRVGDQEMNQ